MVASDVRHAFSRWSNWPEAATRVIASMRKLDDDVKEGRRVCYTLSVRGRFGWMVT